MGEPRVWRVSGEYVVLGADEWPTPWSHPVYTSHGEGFRPASWWHPTQEVPEWWSVDLAASLVRPPEPAEQVWALAQRDARRLLSSAYTK